MNRRQAVAKLVVGLLILIIALAGLSTYAFLRVPSGGGGATQTVVVTSTVGGGATQTVVVTSGGSNATLVQLAKQEGTVTIYGSMDASTWEGIVKPAFLAQYPWATVSYVSLPPAQITNRALSEFKAGKVSSDLLINSIGSLEPAIIGGAVNQWNDSSYLYSLGYNANNTDPQGYWSPGWILPVGIIYNTHLLSAQQAPKSVQDFANSTWKGKIVMQDPAVLSSTGSEFASLYPSMGNSSWTSFMRSIAANSPTILASADTVFADVSTGSFPVGVGFMNDYISCQEQGNCSIGFNMFQPAIGVPNVAALSKNSAHPYMAELLMQWLASVPGQTAISQTGRPPMNPFVLSKLFAQWLPSSISVNVANYNNPSFYSDPGRWSDAFHSIFS